MELASMLRPSDFGMLRNRQVFEAISTLSSKDLKVDFLTVSDALKRHGTHNQVGGDAYLTKLATANATATTTA
jgi:replicative DNA helicase